jgi:hypothetical protein
MPIHGELRMKSLLFAAAIMTAAANLSPASAEGPRASSSNFIPPTAEGVGYQSPVSVEGPKVSSSNTIPQTTYGAAARAPHYEWQNRYVGRHTTLYQGHWVLVQ